MDLTDTDTSFNWLVLVGSDTEIESRDRLCAVIETVGGGLGMWMAVLFTLEGFLHGHFNVSTVASAGQTPVLFLNFTPLFVWL
jgi:hypothetical protein